MRSRTFLAMGLHRAVLHDCDADEVLVFPKASCGSWDENRDLPR